MAAAVVGQAFLSPFIQVVLDKLASPEFANLIHGKKLDQNLLRRLKNTLYAVKAVLNDAEQKQIKDPDVNKWLDDLKDAVYIADDMLDHFSTKAATPKEASNLFSRFLNFQDREMINQLEQIVATLESIFELKDILGLKEIASETLSCRLPSTSLDDGSNVYGRDKDKEAILKLLLDDDNMSDGNVSVIPIVGMGGVGKTTLAQSVYNDNNLKPNFNLQAWACVSDEFDVLKVTKTIFEAVTEGPCNMTDINLLHLKLKDKLTGNKFLIVLDDVWSENYVDWDFLIKPLQFGTKGSKILVTTRSKKVASMVQPSQGYHHLNELSDEDCWSVFAKHACVSLQSGENMALEKIGREIVKKCKGLPLAAQSLGRLLRAKHDIREWNNILNCNIWELSENESQIIPALRISYHYLPPHLKRCFVHCSLYPKDYCFRKDELICVWMAEDLVPPPKNGETLIEVGYKCFDDLASRSFFQQYSEFRPDFFGMHDLVHDLATSLGGEFYFRSEECGKEIKISTKVRHLSFNSFADSISEESEVFGKAKHLRTFLHFNIQSSPFSIEKVSCVEKVSCMVLSNFKYLRHLSFCNSRDLDKLPDSIGELIHLRYLNLSLTRIKTLPESLCNLYNLQTLKLFRCGYLTTLPSGMQKLVNLCHLDFAGTKVEEMPRGISKLNHLQHLTKFIVGKHEENEIKELGKLSNLHGPFRIVKLENVSNSIEASEAKTMNKKHLDEISLNWSKGEGDNAADSQTEMDILDKLQPHQNLRILRIDGYRGTRFPDWVGHSSYHNMTSLSLSGCKNCSMLPSLGRLPSLRQLRVEQMDSLGTIGAEFYKKVDDSSFTGTPFPSLESLKFSKMPNWENWHPFSESDAAFPQLKSLEIRSCPRLKEALPTHLPALKRLTISECEQLASSVPRAPSIRIIHITASNKVTMQQEEELPLSVQYLTIEGCQMVESMLEAISKTQPTFSSLKQLSIRNCSSALSFPVDCLPASLEKLWINNCRKLEFPKYSYQHESLTFLSIYKSCDSLTSLSFEIFPNLTSLLVKNCENLVSWLVSRATTSLQKLGHFTINGCRHFESFPTEGFSAPSMTRFTVSGCNKLKSLPCHMNTLLPKLESIEIHSCRKMESFPEGGMPPSLRTLQIWDCNKLLRSPSLATPASLNMLTSLSIGGPCNGVKSFPMQEGFMLLPSSLTSLSLNSLRSVETLECRGLLHLTSLQKLEIFACPELENIAGEKLPASLMTLEIHSCPLLRKRYQTRHPHIWPKISHIPTILI